MADAWVDVPKEEWVDIAPAPKTSSNPTSIAAASPTSSSSRYGAWEKLGHENTPEELAGAINLLGSGAGGGQAGNAIKAGVGRLMTAFPRTTGAVKGAALGIPSWMGGGVIRGVARGWQGATRATQETAAPNVARQALNSRLVLSPAEAAREAQLAQLAEAQTQLERPAARLAGMRNAGR